MKKDWKISHFYSVWHLLEKDRILPVMEAAREGGIEFITLDGGPLLRALDDPEFAGIFHRSLEAAGMKVFDVHGVCGPKYDLDIDSGKEAVDHMIATHKKCISYGAELGAKTYTLHIGALVWCREKGGLTLEEVRRNTIATLEKLLPEAEKNDVILCVENAFEPVNTPGEAAFYAEYFSSPFVGCCLDTGHANMMLSAGKKEEDYSPDFRRIVWRNALTFEDSPVAKMAPHIVTCHLHDNDGINDSHMLPGTGTTDWQKLMAELSTLPRLLSIQNESTSFTPEKGRLYFMDKAVSSLEAAKGFACSMQEIFTILAGDGENKNTALKEVLQRGLP